MIREKIRVVIPLELPELPAARTAQDYRNRGNQRRSDRILSVMDDHARIAAQRIAGLNDRFGIPGVAEILSDNGSLPKVHVTTTAALAEIYLHGAQVTSWRPVGADEAIFLSEHSRWEDGRAIRGGIPVCFPWFRAKADAPKAPAHGLVRTRE